MKDRVPTYPGRVTLTPVAGQNNTFDMVRADSPVEAGTPLNKASLLSDATASLLGLTGNPTPNDALNKISENFDNVGDKFDDVDDNIEALQTNVDQMLAHKADKWELLNQYTTAGTYTFTATEDMHIGIYMIGGGGMGGKCAGGGSGYAINIEADILTGATVSIVVGRGRGKSGSGSYDTTVTIGGTTTTAAAGESASTADSNSAGANGGQGSDACSYAWNPNKNAPYGGQRAESVIKGGAISISFANILPGGTSQSPRDSQNRFDQSMITLAAGGCYVDSSTGTSGHDAVSQIGATVTGGKAGNGTHSGGSTANATGYGNGGGAAYSGTSYGTGADGAVFIYRRGI